MTDDFAHDEYSDYLAELGLEDGPLDKESKRLAYEFFERGEAALVDAGFGPTQITSFLSRKAVQKEIERLRVVFNERDEVVEKVRFRSKLGLVKLVPLAIHVLGRALVGEDAPEGEQAPTPPAKQQVDTAKEVLYMLGVHRDASDTGAGTYVFDNRSVNLQAEDPSLLEDTSEAAERRTHMLSVLKRVQRIKLDSGASVGETLNELKEGKHLKTDKPLSGKPKKKTRANKKKGKKSKKKTRAKDKTLTPKE